VASIDTAIFSGVWVPPVDSVYELVAVTSLSLDEDLTNDTLRESITVLPVVTVSGGVKDSLSGNGIDAWLYFNRIGPPGDTLWDSTYTDVLGDFSLSLVTGTYDIGVRPAVPYPDTTVSGLEVVKDSVITVDIRLGPAVLLIMDDDEGKTYEDYYTTSLETLGVSYICWDVFRQGVFPTSSMNLFGSPIIIWFTGDAFTNTLTPEDQDSLIGFLNDGGNLFLTGQNIGQDIGDSSFYSGYLHSAFVLPTTNDHTVDGVPGDAVGDGLKILTAGSPGAGNQISQDVISPGSGADSVLLYSPLDCGAVKYDSGIYKVVYFGFGFEGIASRPQQGYANNHYVMWRILHWLDPTIVAVEEEVSYSYPVRKSYFSLDISPNPFKTEAAVSFSIPGGTEEETSLIVYDLSGRLVSAIWNKNKGAVTASPGLINWDGSDARGRKLPSGVYFLRLNKGDASLVRKVVVLR